MRIYKGDKIGIVIVHYGNPKDVESLLNSIKKVLYSKCRVYVVDNSSNNLVKKIVTRLESPKQIYYIDPKDNLGWAKGANFGAKIAIKNNCSKLCFLTSDTVVKSKYFFENLVKPLEDKRVGMSVPVVVYFSEPKTIWMSGGKFFSLLMLARLVNNNKPISMAKNVINPDFGGLCVIRTDVFKKIGGWNGEYFLYYEDVELGYKVKMNNMSVVLVSNSVIAHKVSTPSSNRETKPLSTKNAYFYGRGSLLFIRGNLSGLTKVIATLSQLFIQIPMFVMAMIRQKNFSALMSYFRGTLVGLSILVK
jgi:GT2 family glycosyltransferase